MPRASEALATLPSLDELRGKLLGLFRPLRRRSRVFCKRLAGQARSCALQLAAKGEAA